MSAPAASTATTAPAAAAAPVKKTASKKKAAATTDAAAPAPAVDGAAAPAAAAPVAKKAPRKAKATTETAAAAAAETAAPAAEQSGTESAPSADEAAAPAAPKVRKTHISKEDVEAASLATEGAFNSLINTIKEKKILGITKLVESLRKQVMKANHDALRAIDQAKKSSRRKSSTGSKKPSGLDKPVLLSSQFAEVIGADASVPTTRGVAIGKLYEYMKSAGLKDPANGRKVTPDTKILSLLEGWNGEDLINYITVRKYLKHHFTPSPVAAAETATSA